MAERGAYKHYNRRDRQSVLETNFSKGMMSSDGPISDGYAKTLVNMTFDKDTSRLIPRPSICPTTVIFPDTSAPSSEDYLSPDVTIKDGKECVEDNKVYQQFILGKTDPVSSTDGEIWVSTARPATEATDIELDEYYDISIDYTLGRNSGSSHKCKYYTADLASIHNVDVVEDMHGRIEFPVGTFAYGNSYYFFGEDTIIEEGVETTRKGLFRTKFDPLLGYYVFEYVEPKKPSVSEAVAYGYNLLLNDKTYTFEDMHQAGTLQLQGILPYNADNPNELMMTPKQNQPITFRCYYDVRDGYFDVIWEWRETTSADWTVLQHNVHIDLASAELKVERFIPPAKDMMVRVSAYRYVGNTLSDIVEHAMTVGFDFTESRYGSASAIDQEYYDLTTATGVECWNNRLVVWGLPKDPTILFISDYNEPGYFPYPNNITVFDSPVIYAVEFMDGLAVFTTDKLYYVTLADDGNSWKTELLQSHLNINPWDKHLVQTVRNMLYFKSGNYYYMEVPKAQSTTGKLTIAPITNPITSFFDNFSVNVQNIFRDVYDYTDTYDLVTYYNYLDYEDIHNCYVYKYEDSSKLVYLDVIYNTVDRTWKVWVYEGTHMFYPYRHDATQTGILATTSLLKLQYKEDEFREELRRFIQLFRLEKHSLRDFYIPTETPVIYDDDFSGASVQGTTLIHPDEDDITVDGNTLVLPYRIANKVLDNTLYYADGFDYYYGFFKSNIRDTLYHVYNDIDEYFDFRNYQFIDTGYRDDELFYKKRYRELQLQLNNLDKKDMQFGMEYILDGADRPIFYKYDTHQMIDEFNPDYGVVYIDSTPYLSAELKDIDMTNQWTLDQSLNPEIAMWKIRIAISGKGYAPRLRLFSRNEHRFEILGINWVSKIMHSR